MADFEPRLIGLRVLCVVVLIGSLIFMSASFIGMVATSGVSHGYWVTAFSLSFIAVIIGFAFYGLGRLLMAVESNTYRLDETMNRVLRHLNEVKGGIDALNESILLSEDAKSVAFRDKDLQALRQAIEEEITTKDWESALYLAEQMEKRFGNRQEAKEFRTRITELREEKAQQEMAMAMAHFEDFLASCDWDSASKEMEKLQKAFPDAPEVVELPERLDQARTARKKELLQQWDEAIQKNEIDRSIEILKELDRYLTRNEAAALEESARGAFKAKLHNMGIQFSLLVAEKLWDKAMEVGEEIMQEFPNSRMAQEIRERLSTLRSKAAGMKQENKG